MPYWNWEILKILVVCYVHNICTIENIFEPENVCDAFAKRDKTKQLRISLVNKSKFYQNLPPVLPKDVLLLEKNWFSKNGLDPSNVRTSLNRVH